MNRIHPAYLLALIWFPLALSTRGIAAEVPAEVRVLRRTLAPLVGGLTNSPVESLEKRAAKEPTAALALAWRLAYATPADPVQGQRWVERAAELGDANAQFAAGALAADADRDTDGEILGDFETAREWWEKAAAQGHVSASARLGDLLWDGRLETNDGAGAFAVWLPVAPGCPEIERRLGLLFLCWRPGRGLFQDCDPEASRKWLTAATQHGDSAAGYALQYLADWEKRAAARQQSLREWIPAATSDFEIRDFGWMLGPTGPKNPPANVVKDRPSISQLSRAPKSGGGSEALKPMPSLPDSPQEVQDLAVRCQIAELLWTGSPEFQARPQQAIYWYLSAARDGHAPAMRRIGKFWEDGINGQPDADEAQRWYRRAEAAERDGKASAP